nr:uncharacterized protein LOC109975997 [Labrus bergylta]XP_020483777.1 uncharacterized protein LOC109978998 [Labrus bergylta]
MESVDSDGVSASPAKTYTVWIIGDSCVRRGAQRAAETEGRNLGLKNVHMSWFGWGGLRWKGLLPFFENSLRGRSPPDGLIIHCGGNSMGHVSGVVLVNMMKEDLQQLHARHPGMKIMLSALTQRCQWRHGIHLGKIDKSRSFVNSVMATFVGSISGAMIEHPQIRHDSPGLFLKDGVHFTSRGNDIFLSNFAHCLKDHFQIQ